MPSPAFVFDAYDTLFDLSTLVRRCLQLWPNEGARVAALWRTKQLEYTWLLTSMHRYQSLAAVTRAALVYATQACNVAASRSECEAVAAEYGRLDPFPDVAEALLSLKRQGRRLAILSDGSPDMLRELVTHYRDAQLFDQVVSVDAVRTFKPAPETYRYALRELGLRADQVVFVSAHGWDVAGAHAAGLPTIWINRDGAVEERLGGEPRAVLRSLAELPRAAAALFG